MILGVILSTLHQSSLGTLFLIMPEKMNALWYTPLLPILFCVGHRNRPGHDNFRVVAQRAGVRAGNSNFR